MSDIQWAEESIEPAELISVVVARSVGLGLLAGAGEFMAIGAQSALDFSFDEAVVLAVISMVSGVVLAVGFGLLMATAVGIRPKGAAIRVQARALGLVGGALAAWHLWPSGVVLLDAPGRLPSAMAFFAMPLGVMAMVGLNVGYWTRRKAYRVADELPPGANWTPVALGASVLMVLITAFVVSGARYGTGQALESDPPVVLITVDSLRRDHVSIYGDGEIQTPAIDELGKAGVVFDNAVTPMPETAPAHAAMFTGIHPVRTGVLSNAHGLATRYKTLAERLEGEGYATAAFVSSVALDSRSGLDQGFQVYDDDFIPGVRGVRDIRLAGYAVDALMRWGDVSSYRPLIQREGEETLGRAVGWLRDHGQRPFFMWVHLSEPHAPYETHGAVGAPSVNHLEVMASPPEDYSADLVLKLRQLYAEEVLHTDQLVGDFLDAVREVVDRPMTVIFTSGHGEMLGEHGIHFNHRGIYDETVRVPLMVVPHKGPPLYRRIPAQVRLMDIPNTVLALLGIDQDDGIESGDLTTFMEGTQERDYGTFLLGQASDSVERGSLFGYRAAKADGKPGEMLKFIWNPGLEHSWLYDLVSDPEERADMSLSQASVVEAMQIQVRKELGTAAPEGPEVTEVERRALEALGTIE